MPNLHADWWTLSDIAEYLGVEVKTVRTWLNKRLPKGNPFPEPDHRFGTERVWRPATIVAWNAERPGRGNWGRAS